MKEKRYLKDKKITILGYREVDTDYGTQLIYEPLPGGENIWAYYRQASGSEFYGAATINVKIEAIFRIAWRKDINTYMRIRFKGEDYSITRIDDFEGNKTDLKIYAYILNPHRRK